MGKTGPDVSKGRYNFIFDATLIATRHNF